MKASGENLADLFGACLDAWDINRVGTITMDNHTTNDTLVRSVVEMYGPKDDSLIQNGDLLQVRCWAHVLNLIVQDGLEELKDSIFRVRQAVKYVKASPKRKMEFLKYADQERIPRTRMLVLDICTRWNSTYKMLGSALHYKQAYNRMKIRDIHFKDPPTPEDWETATLVHDFLEVFFNVTELFSGSKYCTSHRFLSEAYHLLLILRETASASSDRILVNTYIKMLRKFEKYWVEKPPNMLLSIATVLDPRCKLGYMQYCYENIYPPPEALEKLKALEARLHKMFDEYLAKFEASCEARMKIVSNKKAKKDLEGSSSSSSRIRKPRSLKAYHSNKVGVGGVSVGKSELHICLEEVAHKTTIDENDDDDSDDDFDILEWWKVSASKYPVLAMMAKDILAIPVYSVALEAAFSTGGRVLSKFRSSLLPSTVEALICAQDWIREGELPHDDELELDTAFQDLSLKTLKGVDVNAMAKAKEKIIV